MLKLKNKLLFLNSVDLLGLKYLIWNKLTNKLTQKLLYKYESFLFLKDHSFKFKKKDFNQFNLNKFKYNNLGFLNWKKISWYYNSFFFNHFNFYFSDITKEKYFSSFFLNNDIDILSFSSKHPFNYNILNSFIKGQSFNNYNYKNFSLFFYKRLKSFLKFKSLNKKKAFIKILFFIEKRKYFLKSSNQKILKKNYLLNLKRIQQFFFFSKFNKYKKFFSKLKTFKKFSIYSNLFLLESRLEFFLVRINFFPTVYFSRQFIKHNKILVNNKICSFSSYQLKLKDIVSLHQTIFFFQYFFLKKLLLNNLIFYNFPIYIEVDYSLLIAQFIRKPGFNEILIPYMLRFNTLNY